MNHIVINNVNALIKVVTLVNENIVVNIKNKNIVHYKPSKKELTKITKPMQPLYEYHVLKLNRDRRQYNNLSDICKDINTPIDRHTRMHLVRGHFKRCKNGLYWWNSFTRNKEANGVIDKSYSVE